MLNPNTAGFNEIRTELQVVCRSYSWQNCSGAIDLVPATSDQLAALQRLLLTGAQCHPRGHEFDFSYDHNTFSPRCREKVKSMMRPNKDARWLGTRHHEGFVAHGLDTYLGDWSQFLATESEVPDLIPDFSKFFCEAVTLEWGQLRLAKYRSQALLTMLVGVLILTVIVTSLSLRVVYMWVIMVTAAIMLVTACVYTTCSTKPAHFTSLHRSSAVPSDTISTLSDHVSEFGFHQNALPPWITDLPPSYETVTASSFQTQRTITENIQPPPYSTAVALERRGLAPGQTSCEEDGASLGCNSPRSSVLSGTMSYTSAMSDMSDSPSQTVSVTDSRRTVSSRSLRADSVTSWESYLPPAYEECSQISRLPEVIITPCHLEINCNSNPRQALMRLIPHGNIPRDFGHLAVARELQQLSIPQKT
uniref:Uncharacterized protein n=1 Tax=Timema bartmani TaxID=61472 RepID=A0A7R9F7I8_9NEOP|nr:unnamed protein product [Timema bartmani]